MADAVFQDHRRKRQDAAYTAWLMGAGDKKSWGFFCEHYALVEVPKDQKNIDKRDADRIWSEHQKLKGKT